MRSATIGVVEPVAGYVLVGGKSSRLGRDKALVEVEGRPLAATVAERVRAAAHSVTLIGPPKKYSSLGFRMIPDSVRDAGPLGGILAALEDSSLQWNLIVGCDMPHLSVPFLKFLATQAGKPDTDIILPVDETGQKEPLCALYATACGETIRREVEHGVRKVTDAFGGLQVRLLAPDDYSAFDADKELFANLNSPEDFRRFGFRGL